MNILSDSTAIGNVIGWVVAGYALLTFLIPLCIFTIMKRCDAIHATLLRIEAQGKVLPEICDLLRTQDHSAPVVLLPEFGTERPNKLGK